jgi:alpha-glucosidase
MLDYFKRAIQLRHDHPVLRHGQLTTLYAEGDVYAMARHDEAEQLIVVLNTGETEAQVTLPVGKYAQDGTNLRSVFGPETSGTVSDGAFKATVPGRVGVVIGI